MFRQGCLVFTGRGSRCEGERKLWCRFQRRRNWLTLHNSFCDIFPEDDIFSRGKHRTPRARGSQADQGNRRVWLGQTHPQGPGLPHNAVRLGPTTSHLAFSHKSSDGPHIPKMYEPCGPKKGKLYIQIPVKNQVWKVLSRAKCWFLSPLPPVCISFPTSFASPPAETLLARRPSASEPTSKCFPHAWLPWRTGNAWTLSSNQR